MTTLGQADRSGLQVEALRTRARVSAHVVWDQLTRPIARVPGEIPWSAEAISPTWLTPILCEGHTGAAVTAVEVSGGSSGSSVRRSIRVTYNEAGRAAGLVDAYFAKSTPTILTRLSSAMSASQEAKFFRIVRPGLPIEAPIHRFSTYERKTGRSFHLFEDLTVTQGAQFCNYTYKLDKGQAEQVVDLLAQVHGRFYDSQRLTTDLGWIPTYEAFHRTGELNGTRVGHDQAMIAAEAVIPVDVIARKAEIWPLAEQALSIHTEEPRTLIHSDVHLGNWYITGDGRMGLCDWQCVSTGSWSRDFAYAVSTIMDVPDRRAWERELMQRYLERLQAFGGPRIGFDHAWTLYRRQTFAALLMWTPTLCHPPTMPDMQPEEMSLEMIRRITAAMSDLEAFDSQPRA
jgi:aminoglycoside phosphotransferase (APT) family kinase protein